jgi:hypothetical protein
MQVARRGWVYFVRGEGILIAVQGNNIQILRKIPSAPVTLMSEITWGL